LDYQTPAAPQRRRPLPVIRITLVLAALVLALVYGAEPVVKTVQAWPEKYRRSRCMRYSAAASQVAYDEDFERSAALVQADPAHYHGQVKADAQATENSSVGRIAEPLAAWKGHHLRTDFPVFLHARRPRGGGEERLVIVCPVHGRWAARPGQEFIRRQFNCDVDLGEGKLVQSFPEVGFFRPDAAADAVRYYAGQPDPGDESHFTIDFDLGARHGVIDGWLRGDDHIEMAVRPGSGVPGPAK
jgi:hypothetical protein